MAAFFEVKMDYLYEITSLQFSYNLCLLSAFFEVKMDYLYEITSLQFSYNLCLLFNL